LRTREAGGSDHRARERRRIDGIGHERQGAAGDAAAAGLFARMGAIEDGDANASARQHVRRPSARGPRTDNRDVITHRSLNRELLNLEPLGLELSVLHYTAMVDVEPGRFTVGVFQDVAWAAKGIAALVEAGLPPASLTILAKDTPDVAALLEKSLGAPGSRLDIAGIGPSILHGSMIEALQGSVRDLAKAGLSGTMRRVGFQAHDCRIFEALVARGGILVAIHSEPRAADALAVLFSYGGGNAAIGAWTGRV